MSFLKVPLYTQLQKFFFFCFEIVLPFILPEIAFHMCTSAYPSYLFLEHCQFLTLLGYLYVFKNIVFLFPLLKILLGAGIGGTMV